MLAGIAVAKSKEATGMRCGNGGVWLAVLCLVVGTAGCGKSNDAASASSAPNAAPAATETASTPGGLHFAKADPKVAREEDLHPIVALHTSLGNIVLKLDAERAPRTVYNFMSYAASGHYNDTIFHQIESGYAILGGGYTVDLVEKPTRYPIPNEATPELKNRRGTIAMAHQPSDPNSATCQFFINLADNTSLDNSGNDAEHCGYCVFGEVIEGIEVLDKIAQVKVQAVKQFASLPSEAVTIKMVTRLR
jgi:cyclophilin family peptidyl-prolyl cis-trans isomerase